ncbi:MAG: AAA domain-containing protein [Pirellulales bacterium]
MPESTPTTDTPAASTADPIRDKAIRLFRYLAALAELRAKSVRDVESYEAIFWFNDLPREKECYTPAWNGGETTDEEYWLRIDKPAKPPLPQPPAECEHWFDAAKLEETSAEPKLYDEIVDPNWVPGDTQNSDESDSSDSTPPLRLLLSDHPHVALAWGKYLATKWRVWNTQYQRWERVQKPYRKLFTIYQEQQRRGEQYELLLGVGVLLWTTTSNHKVRRPIVTARVTIALERESGRITIAPAVDGAFFAVEQDMMEVNERPPIQDQQQIEEKVSALDAPWNREEITPILKGWLHTLPSAADAIYHDTLACPERATRTPQMAFAPILVLRRRGARTMREALKKIVNGLSEGKCIPRGVRNLCGPVDESDGQHSPPAKATFVPEEVLFPLPTNDEQLTIIRRLHSRSGVLVQGPPGTGKSHTIVNLVSHLLASGQRVLVTSQTPRALKVLRDKIPEAILPLTVSLLGEDAESRQNLEHCVQGILRHVNTTNSAETQRQIDAVTRERKSLQSLLANLRRRMREVREAETTVYSLAGTPYEGTAQAIAQKVMRDSETFSWLTDSVSEEAEAPLTDEELGELYSLWEECRNHSLAYDLPTLDTLPTGDEFENASDARLRATNAFSQFGETRDGSVAQRLCALHRERLQQLCKIAQHFIQCCDWLAKRTDSWISDVRQEVCAGRALTWSSLESATSKAIESLASSTWIEDDSDLRIPARVSRAQVLADAADLLS